MRLRLLRTEFAKSRGQTRLESAVALGVLIVAGIGFWMLYKDAIIETTQAMISFFDSEPKE